MNWKLGVAALVVGASVLAALPGCAADATDEAGEEGDAEELEATQDELNANAAKLVGAYTLSNSSPRPPRFEGLVLEQSSAFFAEVDTGIRCITTPCPSHVRLEGTFKATKSYLTLSPASGEPAHSFHGRYKYTLTSTGKLSLTRAGASWKNWSNKLAKQNSFCSEPTDCEGQSIIHPMCVGGWTCGEPQTCSWKCGIPTPTNAIWPADKQQLVAESHGGGFTPPPPAGSTCTVGRAKLTLDIATRKLSWQQCNWQTNGQPLHMESGSRVITVAELATVNAAMNEVTISDHDTCGADKPLMTLSVTSASQGTKKYIDSFYACQGQGTYIDGIGSPFHALRDLAHP